MLVNDNDLSCNIYYFVMKYLFACKSERDQIGSCRQEETKHML